MLSGGLSKKKLLDARSSSEVQELYFETLQDLYLVILLELNFETLQDLYFVILLELYFETL